LRPVVSQGEFIYTKFAFEALSAAATTARPPWSLAVLLSKLPQGTGVGSVYFYSMQTVRDALASERPDLVKLLMQRRCLAQV
jgi:hypothetical protein